jgi:hypothetical protein
MVASHGGYGGPAQASPTIGQCLNGGLSWLEVECNRCKTRGKLPAYLSSTATTKPRCYRLRRPPPKRPTALVLAGFYHECSKKRLKYAFRRPNQ